MDLIIKSEYDWRHIPPRGNAALIVSFCICIVYFVLGRTIWLQVLERSATLPKCCKMLHPVLMFNAREVQYYHRN